jgi:hypothetical protein
MNRWFLAAALPGIYQNPATMQRNGPHTELAAICLFTAERPD